MSSNSQPDVNEIVQALSALADRYSETYLNVLMALAPQIRDAARSRQMTQDLVNAARAGHVRHTPGLPLMIDGVDCSPENVRRLERSRDEYRAMYLGQGSDTVPHWDGCQCSPVCRNRSVTR
jgi:hypothetical protein